MICNSILQCNAKEEVRADLETKEHVSEKIHRISFTARNATPISPSKRFSSRWVIITSLRFVFVGDVDSCAAFSRLWFSDSVATAGHYRQEFLSKFPVKGR